MSADQIKILIIDDDPGDVELVREILLQPEGEPVQLEAAGSLRAGFERLSQGNIDLVLLDLGLPDSKGMATVVKTYSEYPEIPIVVLTGHEDQALGAQALQSGAQDYLSKGKIDHQVFVRSIRYAIERNRLVLALERSKERERREREISALEEFRMNPAASVVAEMYEDRGLQEGAPQLFEQLVIRYSDILDLALEEKVLKIKHGTSRRIEAMAKELGHLKCRPNDVVDLHRSTLKRKSRGQPPRKVEAYTRRGVSSLSA